MISRTMNRFDLHRKHPAACRYAVGPDDSSTGTLLLSLFTIAGTKSAIRPGSIFNRQGGSVFNQRQHVWLKCWAFYVLKKTL